VSSGFIFTRICVLCRLLSVVSYAYVRLWVSLKERQVWRREQQGVAHAYVLRVHLAHRSYLVMRTRPVLSLSRRLCLVQQLRRASPPPAEVQVDRVDRMLVLIHTSREAKYWMLARVDSMVASGCDRRKRHSGYSIPTRGPLTWEFRRELPGMIALYISRL